MSPQDSSQSEVVAGLVECAVMSFRLGGDVKCSKPAQVMVANNGLYYRVCATHAWEFRTLGLRALTTPTPAKEPLTTPGGPDDRE